MFICWFCNAISKLAFKQRPTGDTSVAIVIVGIGRVGPPSQFDFLNIEKGTKIREARGAAWIYFCCFSLFISLLVSG